MADNVPDVLEAHHEPAGALADQLFDPGPEPRGRRQVDLAVDVQDGPLAFVACVESEFHGRTPSKPSGGRAT